MQGGVKNPPLLSKASVEVIDEVDLIPEVEVGDNFASQALPINELGRRLLKASIEGNVEEIKLLMNKGAPFTSDWLGTSPLHFAAQYNYLVICDLLLRAGMSKDVRTKVDKTPLHIAASEGHLEVINCLLNYKADIECKDLLGMTPLHWAVQNCHLEVVSYLVSEGAQIDVVNKFGLTPMEISIQCERYDILDTLKSCVRDPSIATQNLAIQLNEMDASNDIYAQNGIVETQQDSTFFLESIKLDDCVNDRSPGPPGEATRDSNTPESTEDESSCIEVGEVLEPQIHLATSENSNSFTESFRFLQQHGITMLPADDTNILSSVLELGRSVVLTDIGKEVLNSTKPVNSVAIGQPLKTKTLPINQKIITLSAEEFLAMTSNPNKLKQINGKLPEIQPHQRQPVKRIIMKKNKLVPFASKVTKIFTTKDDNIMDVKMLVKQLADAKNLVEQYKQMYLKKYAEAERYKQHILMLTQNKS